MFHALPSLSSVCATLALTNLMVELYGSHPHLLTFFAEQKMVETLTRIRILSLPTPLNMQSIDFPCFVNQFSATACVEAG